MLFKRRDLIAPCTALKCHRKLDDANNHLQATEKYTNKIEKKDVTLHERIDLKKFK